MPTWVIVRLGVLILPFRFTSLENGFLILVQELLLSSLLDICVSRFETISATKAYIFHMNVNASVKKIYESALSSPFLVDEVVDLIQTGALLKSRGQP